VQCVGQELNLHSHQAGGLQPLGLGQCPADASFHPVARVGVEPTGHQGLSLAALPLLAYRAVCTVRSAPPRGFEPLISSLTTRRVLRATPRRRSSDGPGGIRTLSISRSKREWSALAYRALILEDTARGGGRTHRRPGSSRAARPLGVPGPIRERKPWDSNPHAGSPPPVFKTGP
jgi:hypothetical protein